MNSVGRFVALAFGITWVALIPAILLQRGIASVPPPLFVLGALIGSCGPTIAALVLSRRKSGGDGVRSLDEAPGQTTWPRVVVVGAVALALSFALHMIGAAAAHFVFGVDDSVFTLGTPKVPEHWGILVVAPLGEELGWRGYMQRKLERAPSFNALRAGLVVGVAWSAWHAPMIVANTPPMPDLVIASLMIVAGGVIYAALFRASGGSVLVAMLAHAGVHADNVSRIGGNALYATCGAYFVAAIASALWLMRVMARDARGRTASPAVPR
jgi:membrane protease YdiL (CAAX protease family)